MIKWTQRDDKKRENMKQESKLTGTDLNESNPLNRMVGREGRGKKGLLGISMLLTGGSRQELKRGGGALRVLY